MSALLSIQNMTHYFGGLKAVSEFSLEVPQGVIYGLIGPNGSGKTTTFNLVTGIYTPTQGA
ncbi:MAG: livG3 [Spirochaetes bacterium]|nr:MAG: livG3 [Spirochaetota bacterium]